MVGGIREKLGLLKSGQWVAFAFYLTRKILPAANPAFSWNRFVIVQLLDPTSEGLRLDSQAVVATPEDVAAMRERTPDSTERIARRVAQGEECLVVKAEGRPVGRVWLAVDRPSYATNAGLRFDPPVQPSIWWHDVFVEEDFRRRGTFAKLVRAAHQLTGRPTALYAEIHFRSAVSLAAHERLGFKIVRRVTYFLVLGLRIFFVRDENSRLRIEWRFAPRVQRT